MPVRFGFVRESLLLPSIQQLSTATRWYPTDNSSLQLLSPRRQVVNLSRLVKVIAKLNAKNPSCGEFARVAFHRSEVFTTRPTSGLDHGRSFRIEKKKRTHCRSEKVCSWPYDIFNKLSFLDYWYIRVKRDIKGNSWLNFYKIYREGYWRDWKNIVRIFIRLYKDTSHIFLVLLKKIRFSYDVERDCHLANKSNI